MRLDRIDLNLFVVFDALYRERNVTRVAGQLNLTQPAVSNALARLRRTFGDTLFVRTPGGMAPTPVADTVIGDVRRALELLHRSVGEQLSFDPARSEKVFRLGMNDLAEALLMPLLLPRLRRLSPGIAVTTFATPREGAAQELKAGGMDLLLDAMVPNARELGQQRLSAFPYVIGLRRGHPLAGRRIGLEEYLVAEHVHVSSRRRGRGHVDIALNRLGSQRRIALRVQSYLAAARIAQGTDLLWTLPEVLADSLALDIVPLPFEVQALEWNLYWAKSADADPANRWMRELLRAAADSVTGCPPA